MGPGAAALLLAGTFTPSPGVVSVTYTSSILTLTSGSWTTADLGALPASGYKRLIVVSVASWIGTLSALTINGVAATLAGEVTDGNSNLEMAYAEVNTGTTGVTIAPTWSLAPSDSSYIVWQVIFAGTIDDGADITFAAANYSDSVSVNDATAVIGSAMAGAGGSGPWTWTGLTEDTEGDFRSGEHHSGASNFYASASTPTISATATGARAGRIMRFNAT